MALKLLYVLSALDMMNLSMFVVTFGPHVRKIGGTHSQVGMIVSSSAVIALFWNPVAGSMGDNSGRKNILIKCLCMSLLGNLLTAFVSESYSIIFVLRLICAFGAPTGTLIRTLVTDVTKSKEEKATAMSKIGGLSGIMFMVGALIAGFVNEAANGFAFAFAIISFNLVVSLICAFQLPNLISKNKDKKQEGNKLFVAFKALKEINFTQYWELFTIKLLIDFCFGIMQSNMGVILATVFELRGRQMGFVMTLFSIFSIITNFSMIKLRKTIYANDDGFTRLLHGGVMLIITFLGLGLTTTLPLFLVFLALMSISRTLIDSTLTDVLTNQTSDKDKGGILSLFESILSLTGMVCPLISGLIADKYGEQTPILLCIIPALASTLVSQRQKSKSKKE